MRTVGIRETAYVQTENWLRVDSCEAYQVDKRRAWITCFTVSRRRHTEILQTWSKQGRRTQHRRLKSGKQFSDEVTMDVYLLNRGDRRNCSSENILCGGCQSLGGDCTVRPSIIMLMARRRRSVLPIPTESQYGGNIEEIPFFVGI